MPNTSTTTIATQQPTQASMTTTIRLRKLTLERPHDSSPPLTPRGTPVALLDPVAKRPRNATLYAFMQSYLCGREPKGELVLVKPFDQLDQITAPVEMWPAALTVIVEGELEAIARAFPGGPMRPAAPASVEDAFVPSQRAARGARASGRSRR